MPRLSSSLPKYRRHRASGQAVVTLSGRDFYLGPHGTKVSRAEYDRLVGEWLAAGRRLADPVDSPPLTVAAMILCYEPFARQHYRKNGRLTGEYKNVQVAARALRQLYGHTPASQFGPLALKALRLRLIDSDLCRNVVNARIGRIKRIFRWAVSEQLVPASVIHGLSSVTGLQRGRSDARETEPVRPVLDSDFEATLPHLPRVPADMLRVQRLTGCRPEEIRLLKPCHVDRSSQPWVYRPSEHKTEHHGQERIVFIGPRAQAILNAYLLRDSNDYCFSPADSERRRKADLRARRRTKVQPSQRDRRKLRPSRQPGAAYDKDAFARAVRRACAAARVPRWTPNQLRHTAASEIRRQFGLEAAQNVLGHARANVTQVYAERDQRLAARVIAEVG